MKSYLFKVLAVGLALNGLIFCAQAKVNEASPWGEATQDILPSHFDLCFWNIHKVDSEQTLKDIDTLAVKSDILLLQEVNLKKDLDKLYTGRYARSWGSTGVATISNFSQSRAQAYVADSYEFGVFTPKAILLSHFDYEGEDLLVVNVHALNFVAFDTFTAQMKNLEDMIASHQGPLLIAGDFNTWFYTRATFLTKLFGNLGLKEVKFNTDGQRDPRRGRFGLLDRAYVRGLKVEQTEIMKEMTSSDHIPSCLSLSQTL